MRQFSFFLLVLAFQSVAIRAQPAIAADSTNQYDPLLRKTGFWMTKDVKGLDDPFPFTEYGNYTEGRKNGLWTKIDGNGNIKSKESYFKGILNGKVQYFEKGRLIVEGYFRGLNPDVRIDTVMVYDPDLELDIEVAVETERGALKHGEWKYYDNITGQLYKTEIYQIDSLIREKYFVAGYATSDSSFRRKAEAAMPHKKDPTGKKSQSGKVRKSLIK